MYHRRHPLLLAGSIDAGDRIYIWCVALLLVLVACGVFLFVWSGMIYGSYQKILQIDDFTPENKQLGENLSWFSGSYWCLVTALYLGISFYFDNWNISWIIWPVAGVLFAALYQILRNIVKFKITEIILRSIFSYLRQKNGPAFPTSEERRPVKPRLKQAHQFSSLISLIRTFSVSY